MNPNIARKQILDQQRLRYIRRHVELVSPANRADVEAHVEEYINRCKLTSVEQFVLNVRRADAFLGKSMRALTVEDARRLISYLRSIFSRTSVRPRAILIRQHIRWLWGVKRLDEQGSACPDGKLIERALNVPRVKGDVVGIVLSREHQDQLVACIGVKATSPLFPISEHAWSELGQRHDPPRQGRPCPNLGNRNMGSCAHVESAHHRFSEPYTKRCYRPCGRSVDEIALFPWHPRCQPATLTIFWAMASM